MHYFIACLLFFFGTFGSLYGAGEGQSVSLPIEFSIFSRPDCIHCIELKKWLDTSPFTENYIRPKYYDISTPENRELYDRFTEINKIPKITPIILIGDEVIEGFGGVETTGKLIVAKASKLKKSSYFEEKIDRLSSVQSGNGCDELTPCSVENDSLEVNIPLVGVVDLRHYSLPILAIILGFVDGFNPCAMWVLVMFLTILTQTGSRKKMFQIAGIFIFAEAIMYFLILNIWYKTWDFIQLDQIVTPIIGVVSISAGIFFLYEFFTNKDGECKITNNDQKRKTTQKIKEIVNTPMTFAIFLTTIGIAFSVNIIEFACSIGIPQAFTKILEMSSLTFLMKQFYIGIYTLFYMFDDFIVFAIALYAFHYLHLTTRYTRYCLALGGVIMLLLGYFFIFDPSLLKMLSV